MLCSEMPDSNASNDFAVTAIGKDRPGIVAALSATLLDLDGNIEDSRMAILGGHFSVMLIVKVPAAVDRDQLAARIGAAGEELGLDAVSVSPVADVDDEAGEASHVLTVYGADHPGIVAAVTGALAGLGVNITDLSTRLAGGDLYVMVIELGIAGDGGVEAVEAALAEVGASSGVEVSLRELSTEAF